MLDQLQVINDALINTGNAQLNQIEDGSDEWIASKSAFNRALVSVIGRYNWPFTKKTLTLSAKTPIPPIPSQKYGYELPGDCLQVDEVFDADGVRLTQYQIAAGAICCDLDGALQVVYVAVPQREAFTAQFVELLTMKVEASLLRSLNEDYPAAASRDADFERMFNEYRSLSTKENSPRHAVVSRALLARRGGRRRTEWLDSD